MYKYTEEGRDGAWLDLASHQVTHIYLCITVNTSLVLSCGKGEKAGCVYVQKTILSLKCSDSKESKQLHGASASHGVITHRESQTHDKCGTNSHFISVHLQTNMGLRYLIDEEIEVQLMSLML